MAEHSMELELYYSGQWNAAPVYERDGCVVMRGTNDIGNDTEPASGSSTIDNRSGDYSPRSLVSNLRGLIGQNTKSRYVVDGEVVLTGEMASWRPERDVGGDAWTKAEVGGVLRRIGRGKDAFRSPLRRAYAFEPPTCYWPLDDPRDTTILDGTSPLVLINGDLELGGDLGVAGASSSMWPGFNVDPVEENYGAYLRSEFDSAAFSPTGYQVEFSARYHNATPGTAAGLVTVLTTGSMGLLTFIMNPDLWDGASHHVAFYLEQTGPLEVTITRYRDGVFYSTEVLSSIDTIGVPYAMEIGRNGSDTPENYPSLSSVALYNTFSDPAVRGPAAYAWRGEPAGDRFIRVCTEQGITPTVVGTPGDTVLMWVQPLDTFLGILDEIARTDDASIFETRDSVGLTMRTGASRQNQAPALTVSYIGEVQPPLRPEYGDRGIRNDVTAQGTVGPDQRVEQLTGPRNIQAPEDDPQGVGRYATSIDVNPVSVEALYNAAGWRVNIGCFDGTWYAEITVDLDAAPHLSDDVAAIDIGDVLELTDTPEDESLDSFRGLVVGIRNRTGTHRRLVTFYCIPAEPYQTGVLAETTGDTDPFVGHLETDGSRVAVAVAAGAVSLLIATKTGPLWTTTADDCPFDIVAGGQRVTVSSIASALRATFGSAVSNGWGTLDSGQAWTVGAGTVSLFSVTGGVARIAVTALNTEHHIWAEVGYATIQRVKTNLLLAVTPTGAVINWGVLLRRTDASNHFWIDVQVATTGTLTLRVISKIAGVNTQLATAVSATIHSTSVARTLVAEIDADHVIRAKVWSASGLEPGWELTYDASAVTGLVAGTGVGCIARLATGNTNAGPVNFDFDNFSVANPQTFTVSATEYPLSAGADVIVHQPIILTQ